MRLSPLLLLSLVGLGCLRDEPGSSCNMADGRRCAYEYYCSLAEVCTLPCREDADCRAPCSRGCAFRDYCVQDAGACHSTLGLSCIEGHCLASCYADGGCVLDSYAPPTGGAQ